MNEHEKLLQIGMAARRWHAAALKRRTADGLVRQLKAVARLPWHPRWHELEAARATAELARREERLALRWLGKLCGRSPAKVTDVEVLST